MFSKFLKKANIHRVEGATFLIAVFVTILFANSTAFAKIDNGAYLIAATAKQDNTSSQPKSEEDPAKQGHIYYNQNKYADAIKEYTKAINL